MARIKRGMLAEEDEDLGLFQSEHEAKTQREAFLHLTNEGVVPPQDGVEVIQNCLGRLGEPKRGEPTPEQLTTPSDLGAKMDQYLLFAERVQFRHLVPAHVRALNESHVVALMANMAGPNGFLSEHDFVGTLQPDGSIILFDGHHRHEAVRRLVSGGIQIKIDRTR